MSRDFAEAYEEQVWGVYGFFAYRVRSRSDAEDLTQRTFERALRAWRGFDPRLGPLRVWLLAIARNVLMDHYRADNSSFHDPLERVEARRMGVEEDEPNLGIDPVLGRALARLSPRDQEVLALRFGGDLSGPEIAALTELSVANVHQIVSRSLRKLRVALETDARPAG